MGEEVAHCFDVGGLEVVARYLSSGGEWEEGVVLVVVFDDGVARTGGYGDDCGDVVFVGPGDELVFLVEAFGVVVG